MAFRDVLDITVQAGKGGDGGLSFLRLKYMAKGGPDGGHGGSGGSVYLEAVDDVTSLAKLVDRRFYKAGTGGQGEGRNRAGARGKDLTLKVPVGTIARDLDTGQLLADLTDAGERLCIAKGGQGGRGNASFATSTRRAPRFAEYGTPGERRTVRLELRTIADIGLVGYPNAGKSSLLAALSNARPVIASYPFTTLSPNLGVVERDHERLTLADLPGIVAGAHEGKGLGLDFLRHISRTRLLAFVVDIAAEPVDNLQSLQAELEAYDPELLSRPAVVVLNKIDVASQQEVSSVVEELTRFGSPVVAVSALQRTGLSDLEEALFALLPARAEPVDVERRPIEVTVDQLRVERDRSGEGWVVRGRELEALVARFDARNPEAVAYLQHHFAASGVHRLLKRAGAKDGDDVRVGDSVFEYFDEQASSAAGGGEGE